MLHPVRIVSGGGHIYILLWYLLISRESLDLLRDLSCIDNPQLPTQLVSPLYDTDFVQGKCRELCNLTLVSAQKLLKRGWKKKKKKTTHKKKTKKTSSICFELSFRSSELEIGHINAREPSLAYSLHMIWGSWEKRRIYDFPRER